YRADRPTASWFGRTGSRPPCYRRSAGSPPVADQMRKKFGTGPRSPVFSAPACFRALRLGRRCSAETVTWAASFQQVNGSVDSILDCLDQFDPHALEFVRELHIPSHDLQ